MLYLEESLHLVGLHDAGLLQTFEVQSLLENIFSVVSCTKVSQQQSHVGAVGREKQVAAKSGVTFLAPAQVAKHFGAERTLCVGQSLGVDAVALGHCRLGGKALCMSAACSGKKCYPRPQKPEK
jgi:hypothetical protein